MNVVSVDERDSSVEDHGPRFRVYLFQGGDQPQRQWATDTSDVTGVDAHEIIAWARERAGRGLFAVALVREDRGPESDAARRGLVWLVGHDANGRPTSETKQHLADRMHGMRRSPR